MTWEPDPEVPSVQMLTLLGLQGLTLVLSLFTDLLDVFDCPIHIHIK